MLIAFFVNTKADFLKGVTPMKKSAIQSVALLLSLVILALVPSVYADGAINWYCKNNDTFFLEKIREIDGVEDVTLIQYNGEYHG